MYIGKDTVDGHVLTWDNTAKVWKGVAPSSGSALTIKDEGSTLDTAVTSIDFVGGEVTATNVSHAVTVTIPAVTGSSQSQEYTSGAGNFNVPSDVSLVYVTAIGAGGGGGGISATATTGCGGGGSGEYGVSIPYAVTPSGTVAYSVGSKGVGNSGAAGGNGAATTFGNLTFAGGNGGNGVHSSGTAGDGATIIEWIDRIS